MKITTITYFWLTNDLQVLWYGGSTLHVCSRPVNSKAYTSFDAVDCFTDASVKTLEDATDAVVDFYNDLVGTGEIEDYR